MGAGAFVVALASFPMAVVYSLNVSSILNSVKSLILDCFGSSFANTTFLSLLFSLAFKGLSPSFPPSVGGEGMEWWCGKGLQLPWLGWGMGGFERVGGELLAQHDLNFIAACDTRLTWVNIELYLYSILPFNTDNTINYNGTNKIEFNPKETEGYQIMEGLR